MRRRTAIAIVVTIIIIASIFAYSYLSSQSSLTGTIAVSGANALYPMMVEWAGAFEKIHPGVKIDVSAGGAGKGMTDALAGLVDIGMVSRNVTPNETAQGAFYVAVSKDAVVVTVNKNNPVLQDIQTKGFNRSVFMSIYVYGNITTWGQAVGNPSVTSKIDVYTRSDSCGAADVFAKYMGSTQSNLKGTAVNGDPGLAEAVVADSLGIGYNNVAYAYDVNTTKPVDGLAIAPIDINGNGIIDANESFYATRADIVNAISSGAYPSPPAREENLVTKGNFTGVTKEFVKWILTDGQQYCLAAGEVPLPNARQIEMLNKLG
jgi:phosphate transport system substrate-binding protein